MEAAVGESTAPHLIALAGNPNCGKTTLFNRLTGLRYKVANYPGVTVERKEGRTSLSANEEIRLVDLPGIYTLSGTAVDERIAARALLGQFEQDERPDLIVMVVDSTHLERNLYLVSEMIDVGFPLVLALNMADLAEKQGVTIYKELLSRTLGIPVVSIVASKGLGIDELKATVAEALAKSPTTASKSFGWLKDAPLFREQAATLGEQFQKQSNNPLPPELLGSMLLSEAINPPPALVSETKSARAKLLEAGCDPYTFEATARYHWIQKIIDGSVVRNRGQARPVGDAVDAIVTHKFIGSIILFLTLAVIFQSIFLWAEAPMTLIETLIQAAQDGARALIPAGALQSLMVDGIIAGVGNVLVFVPQIAILFFFLGLLEDSGYLSRAAFLLDSIMRRFGLQGRSFIPLLSSFACAIPGILSTRTIASRSDRLATILIAPLMSCSARLPVYAVLIGAFIPHQTVWGVLSLQGLVLLGMYMLGIIGAVVVAYILKCTLLRREPAVYVMEMPNFRLPSLKIVLREVVDRVIAFLKNAATIILACSIILWFLASYPKPEADFTGNPVEISYAGKIGKFVEPAIAPLGFNWEIGVGLLASFAAREVFVSALGTVYNLAETDDSSESLMSSLKERYQSGKLSLAIGLSLMVFYVFACQCMSTLAVCKRETGSWKWTGFMLVYMTVLAYGAAFATFHLTQMLAPATILISGA